MNCEKAQEYLAKLVFGELPNGTEKELFAHLAECDECRRAYDEMTATVHLLQEAYQSEPEPALDAAHRKALSANLQNLKMKATNAHLSQNSSNRGKRSTTPLRVIFEIAAVVAVLAILAGLLMPALNTASERAMKTRNAYDEVQSLEFKVDETVDRATQKTRDVSADYASAETATDIIVENVPTVSKPNIEQPDTREMPSPPATASASRSARSALLDLPEEATSSGAESQSKGFDGSKSAAVLKEKEPTVLTETAVDFADDMTAGETNVEFEEKVLAKPSRSRLTMPGKSSGNREKGGRKDARARYGGSVAADNKPLLTASRSALTIGQKTITKKAEGEAKTAKTDKPSDSAKLGTDGPRPGSTPKKSKLAEPEESAKELPDSQPRAEAEESDGKASFRDTPVNPFVMTGKDRFSTFAMDTDTASYSIARNFLNRGQLPPPAAVRMEEFINAFDYNYPAPKERTFSIFTDGAPSPFGKNLELIKIGIQGRVIGRANRKRANLVFVIDTSGSMAQPDRLPLVKESLKLLVEQLNEDDWVTLITYGTRPRLILDSERAAKAEKIKNTIDSLQTGGSTNLFSGVKLGYEAAARSFRSGGINRIILCSDGAANVGPADSEKLLASVRAFRRQGITFTSAGFGLGTYNDYILEQLANKGDGTYLFIDSLEEARQVFVEQLAATLQYIAKDAKIQVEFAPSRVRRYRLIGYENRDIADDKFRDDTIDAGEVGSGQSVTALYEIELQPQLRPISQKRPATLGTVYIRYRDLNSDKIEEFSRRIKSTCLKKRTPQEDPRFFLAACTAEMAEILRHSEYASHGNMKDVEYYLEKVAGKLPVDKKVRELLKLVRTAKSLLGEQ